MRRVIFLFFLLLGVGVGYLPARDEDWGLRLVMMAVGALFGSAIGGGLSQIGRRQRRLPLKTEEELEPIPGGLGTSSEENITLKLMLNRSSSLWLASTECLLPTNEQPAYGVNRGRAVGHPAAA